MPVSKNQQFLTPAFEARFLVQELLRKTWETKLSQEDYRKSLAKFFDMMKLNQPSEINNINSMEDFLWHGPEQMSATLAVVCGSSVGKILRSGRSKRKDPQEQKIEGFEGEIKFLRRQLDLVEETLNLLAKLQAYVQGFDEILITHEKAVE